MSTGKSKGLYRKMSMRSEIFWKLRKTVSGILSIEGGFDLPRNYSHF